MGKVEGGEEEKEERRLKEHYVSQGRFGRK